MQRNILRYIINVKMAYNQSGNRDKLSGNDCMVCQIHALGLSIDICEACVMYVVKTALNFGLL